LQELWNGAAVQGEGNVLSMSFIRMEEKRNLGGIATSGYVEGVLAGDVLMVDCCEVEVTSS